MLPAIRRNQVHNQLPSGGPIEQLRENSRTGNIRTSISTEPALERWPLQESDLSGRIVCRAPYDLGHIRIGCEDNFRAWQAGNPEN